MLKCVKCTRGAHFELAQSGAFRASGVSVDSRLQEFDPWERGKEGRKAGRKIGGEVADCECRGLFLLSDFPEVHIVIEILGAAQSAGGGPAVLIPDNIMYAGISIYILWAGI